MKNRFSSIDISAILADLKPLITNARLSNIFDLNPKTFILKFNPSAPGSKKHLILIESGIRIHSTEYDRDKPIHPSQFTMKLRKHLRSRRLTGFRQLGSDRVIIFEFHGEPLDTINYNLVCEFYSSGNLILTDNNWLILACLRLVKLNHTTGDQVTYCPGKYLDSIKYYVPPTPPLIDSSIFDKLTQILTPSVTTKKALGMVTGLPAPVIEHALVSVGLHPSGKLMQELDRQTIIDCIQLAHDTIRVDKFKGYIVSTNTGDPIDQDDAVLVYKDLQPILLNQFDAACTVQTFDTFNQAADIYFSNLESHRSIQKLSTQKVNAQKKLDAIVSEQRARVDALILQEAVYARQASVIELHRQLVDSILVHLNRAIASGLDWVELQTFISDQQSQLQSDPTSPASEILLYIDKLDLIQNRVILSLPESIDLVVRDHPKVKEDLSHLFDSDCDQSDDDLPILQAPSKPPQLAPSNRISVPVDLSKSAMKNAEALYTLKKLVNQKQQKTLAAADKAIASASQKIQHDLTASKKKIANQMGLSKLRKPFWFEKFNWFVSSENYLCLAGRDAHQNEILVKRYMEKGDIYVHADLHGAPSVLIKNHLPPKRSSFYVPVPPSTLAQAGNLALCQSKAWTSKIVTSAWWVWWDQVSKSAPTGEYISAPGAFIIRGSKNMLPPCQLVYGMAILFKLGSPESVAAHSNERAARSMSDESISGDVGASHQSHDAIPDPVLDGGASELITQLNEIMLGDDDSEDTGSGPNPMEDLSSANLDQNCTESTSIPSTTCNELVVRAGQPRLSAAARRQMKKNSQQSLDQAVCPNPDQDQTKTRPIQTSSSKDSSKPSPDKIVRGKRGKNKKRAAKYADQSDDEREVAMAVLKSGQGVQPKGKKEKRKAEQKSQKAEIHRLREQQRLDARAAEQGPPQEAHDDQDVRAPPEGMDQLADMLCTLTGQPLADDELLYAVCVCAPYSALLKYKYKVKLTPGTSKKGSSAKLCAQMFYKIGAADGKADKEIPLIKAIPDTEWALAMHANVKISGPLLSDVHKSVKVDRKNRAKAKANA